MNYTIYKDGKVILSSTNSNGLSLEELKVFYKPFYGDDIEIIEDYIEPEPTIGGNLNIILSDQERLAALEAAMNFVLGM